MLTNERKLKMDSADYTLIFHGEGAVAFVCYGWDGLKSRLVSEMGADDEEEAKYWVDLLEDFDDWKRDEAGVPFSFYQEVGECGGVEVVRLNSSLREAVAPQMEDVESHAEDIKTWIGRQPSGITELSYEREAHTTLKYLTDLARQAILSAEREKQRADDAERRMVLLETEDRSNAAMSDRCNRVLRVLRDSGNADAESAFWIIAGDARESREKTNTLTAHLSAIRDAGDEEVDAAKQDCINLLIKIVLARGIEQESRPPHPNPVPSYQQLRERIYKLYDIAIARGQQLREAQEEVQRLRGQVAKIDNLIEQVQILEERLTAIRSAPGMEDVDRLKKRINENSVKRLFANDTAVGDLADIARRAITSRDEVVGLLKFAVSSDLLWIIRRQLAGKGNWSEETKQKGRRILEIVEGSNAD